MHIATDQGLLQEGILAAKSGDRPTAYTLLTRASVYDPNNEMVWLWLASISDQPADQIAHLRRVLEINPRQKQADTNLKKLLLAEGIAVAKAGNKAQAKDLLLELIKLEPTNELGWFWLASVSTTVEDTSHHLNQVLKLNPNNEHARSWLARLQALVENTKAPSKIECPICQSPWKQKVEYCPECHSLLTLSDLTALIENPTADWQMILRGINHLQSLPADKFDFSVHFNLGLAYMNLKQYPKGIAHLQMAGQMRPEDGQLQSKIRDLLAWQQTMPRQGASTSNGAELKKPVSPNRKTILAVDDSPTVRKIVSLTLEKQGHKVISVADGVEALAKLNDLVPDLIFLDISMPHMDGYQICKLIKGKDATKNVPVIMLSGKDGFIDKVRGRLSGATDYITKPFEPPALVEAVKKHCLRRN